jgi:hypothetical protein
MTSILDTILRHAGQGLHIQTEEVGNRELGNERFVSYIRPITGTCLYENNIILASARCLLHFEGCFYLIPGLDSSA